MLPESASVVPMSYEAAVRGELQRLEAELPMLQSQYAELGKQIVRYEGAIIQSRAIIHMVEAGSSPAPEGDSPTVEEAVAGEVTLGTNGG